MTRFNRKMRKRNNRKNVENLIEATAKNLQKAQAERRRFEDNWTVRGKAQRITVNGQDAIMIW